MTDYCKHNLIKRDCPDCSPDPEQRDIFFDGPILPGAGPYAGSTPFEKGSDTSFSAAMAALPNAGTRRRRVYDILEGRGVAGATDDQVEEVTGWLHQTVSARRRELVLLGLVVDSGERRPTRSNRPATVWVCA